jgi:hypothetical protein
MNNGQRSMTPTLDSRLLTNNCPMQKNADHQTAIEFQKSRISVSALKTCEMEIRKRLFFPCHPGALGAVALREEKCGKHIFQKSPCFPVFFPKHVSLVFCIFPLMRLPVRFWDGYIFNYSHASVRSRGAPGSRLNRKRRARREPLDRTTSPAAKHQSPFHPFIPPSGPMARPLSGGLFASSASRAVTGKSALFIPMKPTILRNLFFRACPLAAEFELGRRIWSRHIKEDEPCVV